MGLLAKNEIEQLAIDQAAIIGELRAEIEYRRERWLDIIAQWANDEGISFDATTRLSVMLGLDK